MKKLLSFLTLAGLTIASTGYAKSPETGVLTNNDLTNVSKKISTDKATKKRWKKFDNFLTGVLAVTTGTALASKIFPTGQYKVQVPTFNRFKTFTKEDGFNCLGLCKGTFDHDQVLSCKYPSFNLTRKYIDYNKAGSTKCIGNTLQIVKPQLTKVSFAATAVTALLKLGVKIKRATL